MKKKETEIVVGHLYRVEPWTFSDGDRPKTKYFIPLSVSDTRTVYILPTSVNRFPAQKELRFGEMEYRDQGPFSVPRTAFVMPAKTAVTKKFAFPLDTFIYATCIKSESLYYVKSVFGKARKVECLGAIHTGLFHKLDNYVTRIGDANVKETDARYKNHGLVSGQDGRMHITTYEREALFSRGISAAEIYELETTGEVTVAGFYSLPWKHHSYDPEPPIIEKNLRLVLKSDGVHVQHGDKRTGELFVHIYDIFGQLEQFAYSENDKPKKKVQITPDIQETNSGFSRKK